MAEKHLKDNNRAAKPKVWNADKQESKIHKEQYEQIKARHGKGAADKANYGAISTGDKRFVSVSTKVYGHGMLTSESHHPSPDISHAWEEDD